MAHQKNLRHYFGGEQSGKRSLVEKIMEKLKDNTTLNGSERRYLLEFLQNNSESPPAKRKRMDDLNCPKPKMMNKKVQVHLSSQNSRDYFAQTDTTYPTYFQNTAEIKSIHTKIKVLANNRRANKDDIKQLMEASFDGRRTFILLSTCVADVKQKYPLLFSADEVKNEIDRLFYNGKCREFLSNIDKYSTYVLEKCAENEEIFIRTMENEEKSKTAEQKKYVKAVGSILALPNLVHETLGFVNLPENPCQNDIYPYINGSANFMKDIFSYNHSFEVMVEDTVLCKASNFIEAILCFMASFYIFHLNYPINCQKTMIVFEKLYLCAFDTKDDDIDERTKELIKILKLAPRR